MNLPITNLFHGPGSWIIITLIFMFPFCFSDPRISEAGLFCGAARPPNTTYIRQFVAAMEVLSQLVTANGSSHYTLNSTNISVYTLAQCYGDLSHGDCLQCYAASRTLIPRCIPAISGRVFLDGCFLRYDIYEFYNESVDSAWDTRNCNSTLGIAGGNELDFEQNVGELIDNVIASAAANEGFAVRGNKGVFGLAECWNTVRREGCETCLAKASAEIRNCLPGREGRALNTGCYLRYSTQKFYSNSTRDTNQNSGVSRKGVSVAIALSVVAFCMLCLLASYVVYRRRKKRKQELNNLGNISYSYKNSNLNFKYDTLEKATDYFDPLRKVGQGGAGSVYRGTLPNGKTVAVKRLFFSTRQWVDEFFNEINLISGIEHKNLVKLIGCSIEGPESLLVYEYVPNRSLERYLFDKNRVKILNWKERYNIILGTAQGLSFLHGGLEFRIIHRDIKSSNILLDENLEPKIADFGLARSFSADKTHLSTGIAGTLGYMAPEYIVKGQLTEKADVYSFGVLVIEIVCARKNNVFVEASESLLQTIWKLYKTDRLMESVDACLKDDFPVTEVSKVLRIGLLCAQASAPQRPSMAEVVRMLTDGNCQVAEPNQPPFLNTGAISATSSRSSYSANSFTLNAMMKTGASHLSSESFSIQSSHGHPRTEQLQMNSNSC